MWFGRLLISQIPVADKKPGDNLVWAVGNPWGTPIEETRNPQKYLSDLHNNPFPITQEIIDQIPPSAKKI
jgi:hypothetical protein